MAITMYVNIDLNSKINQTNKFYNILKTHNTSYKTITQTHDSTFLCAANNY